MMRLLAIVLAAGCIFCATPERAMLAPHNEIRARAGVPALTWSDQLASVAGDWAASLLKSGKFEHSPKNRYGENIFETRGYHASATEVVAKWAAEAKDYDGAK